ncbi:Asp-tRNA(Asn)/Glu-tRNA(Gln) amidotransferase subunit GatA [bacterium]|nr:Asp-tRNA(Asn)/Glu-tRNA(Gln) amidotransferase subunit GatA [bacterium]
MPYPGAPRTFSEARRLAAEKESHNLHLALFEEGEGIPFSVKDTICVEGLPTTCASRALEGYMSPFTATAVARLQEAGAAVLGKANCDEFAMGASGETSAYGPSRNPWDRERVTGGSSGGSAALVAAGVVGFALGSDTGGSVRQPAALCGVVGLRPTWGRVSRHGLVAMASSMDTIGVCARTVAEARWVFDAMAGPDPQDATTLPARESPPPHASVRPPTVHLPDPADPRLGEMGPVLAQVRAALLGDGVEILEIGLDDLEECLSAYYTITYAEVSANLARYDGIRFANPRGLAPAVWRGRALGEEVKRRILLGCQILSAGYRDSTYKAALAVRRRLRAHFGALLARGPLLVPAAVGEAFLIGAVKDPLEMGRQDLFTTLASLAGLPAVAVPWCLSPGGLPLGMQVVGAANEDEETLAHAAWLADLAAGAGLWQPGTLAP